MKSPQHFSKLDRASHTHPPLLRRVAFALALVLAASPLFTASARDKDKDKGDKSSAPTNVVTSKPTIQRLAEIPCWHIAATRPQAASHSLVTI